jgi:choline-phosphate cytidylyltransferase
MSKGAEEKVLRLYADGVFDGFHIGHSNMLKQCREAFPGKKVWLIAGVCAQADIETFKGPTISTEEERIAMVAQNRYVDEVYPNAPWILT